MGVGSAAAFEEAVDAGAFAAGAAVGFKADGGSLPRRVRPSPQEGSEAAQPYAASGLSATASRVRGWADDGLSTSW
jgi:hypothetical protein